MAHEAANTAPGDQAPDETQDKATDDFESHFASFASGNAEETPPEEPAAESEQPESEAGEEQGGQPREEGQSEPPAEEPELTEREKELQAQLERLQQSEASQRGRVGALQRQINEFKRQQQAPQSSGQPSASQSTQQPAGQSQQERDQKQAIAEEAGSEDWEAFKQDFPDIANALDARFAELSRLEERVNQRISSVEQSVQPMQEQAHQQYLADQMRALEARHSDWQEVVNAPAFQEWLQQQPQWVQDQMESDNADDASALLDFYKATSQQAGSDDRAAAQQAEREKRNQRLANAQTPTRRGPAQRQAVPDEFEAAFNHYAKKR